MEEWGGGGGSGGGEGLRKGNTDRSTDQNIKPPIVTYSDPPVDNCLS